MPKYLFKEDFAWFFMVLLPATHERFAWFLYSCHWIISIPTSVFNFIYCEGKSPTWNVNIFVGCPWLLGKTRTFPFYKNPNMPFLAELWWCHCSHLPYTDLFHALNQHCSSNRVKILCRRSVRSLWVQIETAFCLSSWHERSLLRTVCLGPT